MTPKCINRLFVTIHQLITFLGPQWKTEILDFCPSTRILLIGCKTDLRTDVCTLMELSNQKQTPITYEQVRQKKQTKIHVCVCADFYTYAFPVTPRPKGLVSTLYHRKKLNGTMEEYHEQYRLLLHLLQGSAMAKQLGAEAYLECSAFTSEKSIHSVFRTAAMACINKLQPLPKPSPTRRLSKRLLHLPSKSDLISTTFKKEKAKSCSVM